MKVTAFAIGHGGAMLCQTKHFSLLALETLVLVKKYDGCSGSAFIRRQTPGAKSQPPSGSLAQPLLILGRMMLLNIASLSNS
jgi:hypothetical protein